MNITDKLYKFFPVAILQFVFVFIGFFEALNSYQEKNLQKCAMWFVCDTTVKLGELSRTK